MISSMLSSLVVRQGNALLYTHGSVVVIQGFPAAKILIKHSTVVRPLHSEWPTVWSKASQPASQPVVIIKGMWDEESLDFYAVALKPN